MKIPELPFSSLVEPAPMSRSMRFLSVSQTTDLLFYTVRKGTNYQNGQSFVKN